MEWIIWIILIIIGISMIISKRQETIKNNINNEERDKKYKDRYIDQSKTLFERNQDIIKNFEIKINKHDFQSSSRYSYYYIENQTRDCINEICIAEGKYNIRPNHNYLSTWKNTTTEEWKNLSLQIEKLFIDRKKEIEKKEQEKKEEKIKEATSSISTKYTDLISQFNEVTYRKVTTIDAYGEENWDALDKEVNFIVDRIAKKQGKTDEEIKKWKKYSWAMPEEYKTLINNIKTKFKVYYKNRKNKPVESSNVTNMSGIDFENHLAQLLKENGFDNVSGTPVTGDQGADLIAKRNGKTIIIQAKRYTGSVGNKAVQEVIGALNFYNGDEGWVITNSKFTKSAYELAKKSNVKLIDGTDMQQFSEVIKKTN